MKLSTIRFQLDKTQCDLIKLGKTQYNPINIPNKTQ